MEAWHYWLISGIVLILTELAIPGFFVIWFGVGALVVALLTAIAPAIPISVQLVIWAIASSAMVVLWFRVFNKTRAQTHAGTADGDVIGETGLVVNDVAPYIRGKVRFQRPILGSDEWPCISDEEIEIGARVKVISIEGSIVKIKRA